MSRSPIGHVTGDAELEAAKRRLTAALARIATSCWDAALTGDSDAAAVDLADPLDLDGERDLMLIRMEWMSLLTREVSEALERIDNDSYGFCLRCGQRIAAKRLAALPWVAFCVACQDEKAESRGT